jgi:hypothetical protein
VLLNVTRNVEKWFGVGTVEQNYVTFRIKVSVGLIMAQSFLLEDSSSVPLHP